MIALIWILTFLLLVLWTAPALLLHWMFGLTPEAVAEIKPLLESIPLAAWLEIWLPGWPELAEIALDFGSRVLRAAEAVVPWLRWILWAVWALGAGFVLLLAGILHAVIRSGQQVEAARIRQGA